MEQTWRWFGPDDAVKLAHARQAGATGIVSALHHIPCGTAWPASEVLRRKDEIESAGLRWSVVESIPVHEEIKLRTGKAPAYIATYIDSLRAVAAAGIPVVCTNFMAITDWTRTDLEYPMPHGGTALRFDAVDFAAYDIFVLKRKNAENEHPPERVGAARQRLAQMSESALATLEQNLIGWVPARDFTFDRDGFRRHLERYDGIDRETFRQNLIEFLRAVAPVCEDLGLRFCLHPDDPPFPIFGLPRVLSTCDDYRAMLKAVDVPTNGVTFCTGSLGARADNDLPAMAADLADRTHFVHLRNVTRERDGSFHESEHLDGDNDMIAVVRAVLAEEKRRREAGRPDWEIPFRPDHGHRIVDDIGKTVNPGYSCIGRLKGLAELRGVIKTLTALD